MDVPAALHLTRVVGLNASWPTLVQFYMAQPTIPATRTTHATHCGSPDLAQPLHLDGVPVIGDELEAAGLARCWLWKGYSL